MSTREGRLQPRDGLRVASVGLRARPLRAALSALGIAIGTAAIVGVLGLSSSSQAGLIAEIDRKPGEPTKFVHRQRGETVQRRRPEIAAGALNPEHLHRLSREGVDGWKFGRRIPAPEIGDSAVGPKEIGAVLQQLELREGGGMVRIPLVRDPATAGRRR